MADTVYIVVGSTYDYESSQTELLKAFIDRAKADAFVGELNAMVGRIKRAENDSAEFSKKWCKEHPYVKTRSKSLREMQRVAQENREINNRFLAASEQFFQEINYLTEDDRRRIKDHDYFDSYTTSELEIE